MLGITGELQREISMYTLSSTELFITGLNTLGDTIISFLKLSAWIKSKFLTSQKWWGKKGKGQKGKIIRIRGEITWSLLNF